MLCTKHVHFKLPMASNIPRFFQKRTSPRIHLQIEVLDPFWCPTLLSTPDKTSEFILPSAALPFNYTNSVGLRYEAMEVRHCLKQAMATRWGIASAGKISHDFVTALATLPSEEHTVVAVAARQLERAQEFAKLHKIPKAYSSYEELAKDENIDVVYIGAINTQHHYVGQLMLNHGKHILCEKPLTMNLKQTTELINLAKEKKLFLMEAVWSRCFPVYEALKKELNAGSLGEVVQVNTSFGIALEDIDRVTKKSLGGSTILDLGVYCLQFVLFVFGAVRPQKIVASGHLNSDGVDSSMSCVFTYEDGKTAVLSTHGRAEFLNEALVIGTKGIARVPNPFWCPTLLCTPDKSSEFILPSAALPFNFVNSAGLRYEAMEVRRCLKQGLQESPKITHEESLLLAELEDELRKQVGVKFPEDD